MDNLPASYPGNISPAQCAVLYLVFQGKSNQEIGEELCVLQETIKFHMTDIYKKFNVKSRAQLVCRYRMTPLPDEWEYHYLQRSKGGLNDRASSF